MAEWLLYQLSCSYNNTYKGEIDLEIVIKLCNYSAEKMRSEVSFVLWSQHAQSISHAMHHSLSAWRVTPYKGRGKDYYTC